MPKYNMHPTFFATCALLQKSPSEVLILAHEWAEQMPTEEEFKELRKIHLVRGQMTAIVYAFCVGQLTGQIDELPDQDMLPPHQEN